MALASLAALGLAIFLGFVKKMNTGLLSDSSAVSILGITAGILSWFSSTSGVVMPTLIPTVPHILAQMGSSADPVEWVTAITMVSNTAGISPLSTGGALAAYSAEGGLKDGELDRLFLRMFFISAAGVVSLSVLAYFGLYRWLL